MLVTSRASDEFARAAGVVDGIPMVIVGRGVYGLTCCGQVPGIRLWVVAAAVGASFADLSIDGAMSV